MRPHEIAFPALLQAFFQQRLVAQRGASAQTIASYRDAFELFLRYAQERTGRPPTALTIADLDAPLILAFLDHLEEKRGNSPRTRDPASLPIARRVLAIPTKRFDRPVLGFLSREEIDALLAAPDRASFSGQRDAVLFATLYNTGARVSEMTGLRVGDVLLDRECALRLHGKGRKERVVPLWRSTAAQLRAWLPRIGRGPDAPVFPNRVGGRLSRSGVEDRLRRALATAARRCPSLAMRRISPHILRHTTAMHLLQSGVEINVIRSWLGHVSLVTTNRYVEIDLAMKTKALETCKVGATEQHPGPWRTDPDILTLQFHSKNIGGWNFGYFKDPVLDKLLDDAREEMNRAKRQKMYEEAQRYIMEQAAVVPLFNQVQPDPGWAYVKDLVFDGNTYFMLYDVWLDK